MRYGPLPGHISASSCPDEHRTRKPSLGLKCHCPLVRFSPMNDRLEGVHLKLDRAEHHITYLNIVHNGDMRPVDFRLLDYLTALFIDPVRHKLGVDTAHRAGRMLDQPGFELQAYL